MVGSFSNGVSVWSSDQRRPWTYPLLATAGGRAICIYVYPRSRRLRNAAGPARRLAGTAWSGEKLAGDGSRRAWSPRQRRTSTSPAEYRRATPSYVHVHATDGARSLPDRRGPRPGRRRRLICRHASIVRPRKRLGLGDGSLTETSVVLID